MCPPCARATHRLCGRRALSCRLVFRGKGSGAGSSLTDDATAGVRTRSSIAALRGEGPLDVKTVFSQARNGRMKRLSESLAEGFDVNAVDEFGNTLLLIAAQNVRDPCRLLPQWRLLSITHHPPRSSITPALLRAFVSRSTRSCARCC